MISLLKKDFSESFYAFFSNDF